MWFDLVEESFVAGVQPSMTPSWFSVVPSLQFSFNSDCCLYRIILFTEFLYILVRLVRPKKMPDLFMVSLVLPFLVFGPLGPISFHVS